MSTYKQYGELLPLIPVLVFLVAFFGFNYREEYDNAQIAGWLLIAYLAVGGVIVWARHGWVPKLLFYIFGELIVILMVLNI